MIRSFCLPALLATTLIALLAGAPADAKPKPPNKPKTSPADRVLRDCVADGDLDAVYKTGAVKLALRRMPKDVRDYTDCAAVLRARITAGRTVFVKRHRARLKVACTRAQYVANILIGDTVLAAGAVPACRRGTRVVSLPALAPRALTRAARKHRTARVVLSPRGMVLSFMVELRPFRG